MDEDSVLLLENRSVVGKIYETFGPVPQPYYSVRFNSGAEIMEKGIKIGERERERESKSKRRTIEGAVVPSPKIAKLYSLHN